MCRRKQVAAELELSWWRSALESLLEADRALLNANTSVLDRLEADFRLVDEAHAAGSAQLLAWQARRELEDRSRRLARRANLLKRLLSRDSVTAFDLQTTAPHLSRTVAPVWLASPYEIDRIIDTMPFDTVILVDNGATTVAGVLARFAEPSRSSRSVTRSRRHLQRLRLQSRRARPPGSRRAGSRQARPPRPTISIRSRHLPARSTLAHADPHAQLPARRRGPRRGCVNRRFYGGRIQSLPWAASSVTAASPSTTSRTGTACPTPIPARSGDGCRGRPRRRSRTGPRLEAPPSRSWSSPRARSTRYG